MNESNGYTIAWVQDASETPTVTHNGGGSGASGTIQSQTSSDEHPELTGDQLKRLGDIASRAVWKTPLFRIGRDTSEVERIDLATKNDIAIGRSLLLLIKNDDLLAQIIKGR